MDISPLNVATDGYLDSPLSVATSGYLYIAIVQDNTGHKRAVYYNDEQELQRKIRDDEEVVLILTLANNLGIF